MIAISPHLVNDESRICRAQNRNYLLAEGFERLFAKSSAFTQFLRYQAQAERLYRRAIEEFERLRKLRHELPNEPSKTSQPAESDVLAEEKTNPRNPCNPRAAQPPHPDHYGPDGELLPHFDRVRPQISSAPPPTDHASRWQRWESYLPPAPRVIYTK